MGMTIQVEGGTGVKNQISGKAKTFRKELAPTYNDLVRGGYLRKSE